MNKCGFNHLRVSPTDHSYFFVAVPSVSAVLERIDKYYNAWRKSELIDYNSIDKMILKKAQERGNCFHRAMENYVLNGFDDGELAYCTCSKQVLAHTANLLLMREWVNNNWDTIKKFKEFVSEKSYMCFDNNMSYCNTLFSGTIDLSFVEETEDKYIIHVLDYKTSSRKEISKWSKQLLLYWYLIKRNKDEIDTDKVVDVKLHIVWANASKNKEIKIIDIEKDYIKEVYNEELLYKAIVEVHKEVVKEYKMKSE